MTSSAFATERIARIGVVASGPPERWSLIAQSVRAGLAERGFVEGRNLVLVERYVLHPGAPVTGRREMNAAVEALLAENLQTVVAGCGWSLRTLTEKTRDLPIVMASVTDPVRQGFVASLARPSGNVTGVTGGAGGLVPKMLEQLHLAFPEARSVGVLYNADNPAHRSRYEEVVAAARGAAISVSPIALARLRDNASALHVLREAAVAALLVLPDDGQFWGYVERIVAASAALRVPAIYPRRDLVQMGGLLSFGVDDREVFRRTGAFIERLLAGAAAATLPVEHPNTTELVIDVRSADRFGLVVTRQALLRADAVLR